MTEKIDDPAPSRQGGSLAAADGFDFLYGRWAVRHRKLRERLAGCDQWYDFPGTLDVVPILGGMGNFDHNGLADPAGAYEAHSLRLFSPSDGRWSVWWLDGRDPGAGLGPPVTGQFTGRKVCLFGDDTFASRKIRVRTTYEPLGDTTAQWTQAFQEAGGDWEVNWVMDFTRIAA